MMFFSKVFNLIFYRTWLKISLRKVGGEFRIGPRSIITTPSVFEIGSRFFTGPYAYLSSNLDTRMIIGDNVMCGPYVKIIGGNHNIIDPSGPMMDAPYLGPGKGVLIEDDVWIGAGVTILDGAIITEGTVVAAGAVVNCRTRPYSVYGGVPARFIKNRFDENQILCVKSSKYTTAQLIASINLN